MHACFIERAEIMQTLFPAFCPGYLSANTGITYPSIYPIAHNKDELIIISHIRERTVSSRMVAVCILSTKWNSTS